MKAPPFLLRHPARPLCLGFAFLCAVTVAPFAAAGEKQILRLATSTSTVNSGLTRYLFPAFERATGYAIKVFAVGSGRALRYGRNGRVDAVLVHAPEAERRFVSEGNGVARHPVMHNDFVVLGPAGDPAGIRGLVDVRQAFSKIRKNKSLFVTRGDDSGTQKKELEIWTSLGVTPFGLWYYETGDAMAGTLQAASRQAGYVLTDRGTWLALKDRLDLELMIEGDSRLFNPYGVIAVNPGRHPSVNHTAAKAFVRWLTSKSVQQMIGNYRVGGQRLFTPTAARG